MALMVFKSDACADLPYFEEVARRLLELIGKEATPQGVITVEQLPEAIARLAAAIERDRPQHRAHLLAEAPGSVGDEADGPDAADIDISLTRRALPLLETLRQAHAAGKPVLWGV